MTKSYFCEKCEFFCGILYFLSFKKKLKLIDGNLSNSINTIKKYKMATYKVTTPLTAEQFEANDRHHKMLIDLNVKLYTWADTGNAYKCDEGTIKPATIKAFVELVDIVSKDFARQYISLPDVAKLQNGNGFAYIPAAGIDKKKLLERVWGLSLNHKNAEKPKKVKKGKKNRGKR